MFHPLLVFVIMLLSVAPFPVGGGSAGASTPEEVFQDGLKRLRASDISGAERVWKNVLGDRVAGPAAYVLLARGHHAKGNHHKTVALLKEFRTRHPGSLYQGMADRMLAEALVSLKSPEAVPMLTAMIDKASDQQNPPLIGLLGKLHKNLGNHVQAAEHYRKLYLLYPSAVEGLKASEELAWMAVHGKIPAAQYSEKEQSARAEKLSRGGRFDLAAEGYRNLLKARPSNADLELKLATCLFKERKNDEAEKVLKGLLGRNLSNEDRMETLHLMTRLHWRVDRNGDFVSLSQEIIQKGNRRQKDRAHFNLAAHYYELGNLSAALEHFNKVVNNSSNPSLKSDAGWKIAWIKYRTNKYEEAAEAFRQARVNSPGGGLADASRYWQARCLIHLNRSGDGKAILKQVARQSPLEYYGQEAERLLKSMGSPSGLPEGTRPFPDVTLKEQHLSNERVADANKLMEWELYDLALVHLDALPESVRSSPAIAFMRAKAAHGARHYKKAREIVFASFGALTETPSEDVPPEFVELAFPRVFRKVTSAAAKKHGVDPHLVWAVVRQESRYDTSAVSPAGALGLMQVTPAAAGVRGNRGAVGSKEVERILDPENNLALGIRILSKNLASFKGKTVLAVAAYNADINKVRSWVRRNGKMDDDEFIENIPFLETRLYVKKVLAGYRAYSMLHQRTNLVGLW